MLPASADVAEVMISPDSPTTYAPAIQVLNRRGEVSSTLDCLRGLKPYAKYLPDSLFRNGPGSGASCWHSRGKSQYKTAISRD